MSDKEVKMNDRQKGQDECQVKRSKRISDQRPR